MMYVELVAVAVLTYLVLTALLVFVGWAVYRKYAISNDGGTHECYVCKKVHPSLDDAVDCAIGDVDRKILSEAAGITS